MELNLFKLGSSRVGLMRVQDYGIEAINDGGGMNTTLQQDGGGGNAYYTDPSYVSPLGSGDAYYMPVDSSPTIYAPKDAVINLDSIPPLELSSPPVLSYPAPSDVMPSAEIPQVQEQQTQQLADGSTGTPVDSMESYGNFLDANHLPISAKWQWYNIATGEVYSENQSTAFHVWGDTDLQNVALRAKAPGYSEVKVMALDMLPQFDIVFKRPPYALIAAAILALILFAKKRKKKVGKVTLQDVIPFLIIGGGLLAFSLVRQLLESLGIWKGRDTKDLDDASTDPSSFWNPNYWREINPSGTNWTYAITADTAAQWAADLYNAFGAFNDNEEQAIAVFKRCRTKANASFLCDVFQRIYNEDCLTFLRGGWWPQDRLSDADVNTITQYINKLPNY